MYQLKMSEPCPGTCGINAECQVSNHNYIYTCHEGYTGDPFVQCSLTPGSITPQNHPTPASLHSVDPMPSVQFFNPAQCANVCLVILENLLPADQSALSTVNVPPHWRVSTYAVLSPVLGCVA